MTSVSLISVSTALNQGEWEAARAHCRELLAAAPDCARAHHAIGLSLCGEQSYDRAIPHFERACEIDRTTPGLVRDLGVIYARVERWVDASACLERVLGDLDPEALSLYLLASVEAGRAVDAVVAIEALNPSALEADPQLACEFGRALLAAGDRPRGERILQHAVAIDRTLIRAHESLGSLYDETNHGDRALGHWSAYAQLQPASGYAQLRLAMAYSVRGRHDESRRARLAALQLGLTRPEEYSQALYLMLFDPSESGASLLRAYRAAFTPVKAAASPTPRRRRAGERLRVGYLSGEFRSTPAFYFLSPFLSNHDRSRVEVFLYNSSPIRDSCTPAYLPFGEHWRETSDQSDDGLMATVRADGLDVLVDLSGHFPHNRLRAFTRRLAPVQATFPNYPSTTGCPGVDYFFSDRWTSPPGTDGEYAERLYRLPAGYLVYAPPFETRKTPLPALSRGHITFGLFQRLSKITPAMWDGIARVLQGVPGSRLLVHNGDAELDRDDSPTASYLKELLDERDIDPARLILRGDRPLGEHLSLVAAADIGLDTCPYNGQTTTCECLWMGLPVVSIKGSSHVSRVSGALLERIGHPRWSTESMDDYIDVATALASDLDALNTLRDGLRTRCIASGLTDGITLTRDLEAAYTQFLNG